MISRTLLPALFTLASFAAVAQSSLMPTKVLEWRDVMKPSVVEERRDGFCTLLVRGFSGHSALVVNKTTVVSSGKVVHVIIELGLTDQIASGNFEAAVVLDRAVNQVVFGNAGDVLWWRENSKCPASK